MAGTSWLDQVFRRAADLPGVAAFGHYGWPAPLVAGIGLHVSSLDGPVRVAALVPVLAGCAAVAAHGQQVASCEPCRPRLARPVDPASLQVQAARAGWLLRLTHAPWRSVPLWALVTAALVLDYAGAQWLGPVGRWLSAVPMTVVFVAGLVAAPRAHTRLETACPWCHDDGHSGPGGHGGPGGRGDDGDPQPMPSDPGGLVPDHIDDVIAGWDDVPAIPDPITSPVTSPVGPVPERVRVRVPRPLGIGGAS